MKNHRSIARTLIAGAATGVLFFSALPALADITDQPSSPIRMSQCTLDPYGGTAFYNRDQHWDLTATLVNRSNRAAKLVGVTTEFFDESGSAIKRLDAAFSGRYGPGVTVGNQHYSLGTVLGPVATQRCYVSRVEFADGTVWSVVDHFAEVERPPSTCRVAVKDGSTFDASWNGALCLAARDVWNAAHRAPVSQRPG